ncbi:hypothetical protein NUKP82_38370 [Klebsiella variicola]|nr:hypothetical protein NUKP82_38370 [Klebsiella variicola]
MQANRGGIPWARHTIQYIHSPYPTEKEPVITPKTCQSGANGSGGIFIPSRHNSRIRSGA